MANCTLEKQKLLLLPNKCMWSLTVASEQTQHGRPSLPVQRWCFPYTAQEAKPTCSEVVFSVHSTGGQAYLFRGGVFRTQHRRPSLPVQRWCFPYTAQEAKPTCSEVVFSVHSTGGQTYLFKGGVFRTQQNLVRLWQKAVLILREHVHVGHGIQHFICSRSNSSCHQHFLCNEEMYLTKISASSVTDQTYVHHIMHFLCNESNLSHCDLCFICNRSNVCHSDQHFCNGLNINQCNQHLLCEQINCPSL